MGTRDLVTRLGDVFLDMSTLRLTSSGPPPALTRAEAGSSDAAGVSGRQPARWRLAPARWRCGRRGSRCDAGSLRPSGGVCSPSSHSTRARSVARARARCLQAGKRTRDDSRRPRNRMTEDEIAATRLGLAVVRRGRCLIRTLRGDVHRCRARRSRTIAAISG